MDLLADPDNPNHAHAAARGKPGRGAKRQRLEILSGVTGAFRPGVLTALVGVSGAGKTTLMDVLAGRKTSAPLSTCFTAPGLVPCLHDAKPSMQTQPHTATAGAAQQGLHARQHGDRLPSCY